MKGQDGVRLAANLRQLRGLDTVRRATGLWKARRLPVPRTQGEQGYNTFMRVYISSRPIIPIHSGA